MARAFAIRRAAAYRERAQQLTETAAHERREDVRRHLLDQAATFSAPPMRWGRRRPSRKFSARVNKPRA